MVDKVGVVKRVLYGMSELSAVASELVAWCVCPPVGTPLNGFVLCFVLPSDSSAETRPAAASQPTG